MQANPPTQDNETMRQGDFEPRLIAHPFPSASFIEHATTGLLMLQQKHLNLAPCNNMKRLLARHGAGLGPQAPHAA